MSWRLWECRATYGCSKSQSRCEAPAISKPAGGNVRDFKLLRCAGELTTWILSALQLGKGASAVVAYQDEAANVFLSGVTRT